MVQNDDDPKLENVLNSADQMKWRAAVMEEVINIHRNKTWVPAASIPKNAFVIPSVTMH